MRVDGSSMWHRHSCLCAEIVDDLPRQPRALREKVCPDALVVRMDSISIIIVDLKWCDSVRDDAPSAKISAVRCSRADDRPDDRARLRSPHQYFERSKKLSVARALFLRLGGEQHFDLRSFRHGCFHSRQDA